MKISKANFKNNNTNYSILVGMGAIKSLKKQIDLVCPDAKKVALIFDSRIPKNFKYNGGVIYIGNKDVLKQTCPGVFGSIEGLGVCMIGSK